MKRVAVFPLVERELELGQRPVQVVGINGPSPLLILPLPTHAGQFPTRGLLHRCLDFCLSLLLLLLKSFVSTFFFLAASTPLLLPQFYC